MSKPVMSGVAAMIALAGIVGWGVDAGAAPKTDCEQVNEAPQPAPKWAKVFSDSDHDPDVPTNVLIEASAGTTTCKGSMAKGVSCKTRGPATLRVTIQDYVFFKVPAKRTASLILSKDGNLTCTLKAS